MSVHLEGNTIVFADGRTTAPAVPTTADHGTSLADLKKGGTSAKHARVKLTGDMVLTGPVSLYLYDGSDWGFAGELHEGADIDLATHGGHFEIVRFIGLAQRLEVVPTGVGVGTYSGEIEGIAE